MPQEPDDRLERMLAEDEAAISDEGFSRRVLAQTRFAKPWRATVLYGAGFAGAGFAVGGIVQLWAKLPRTMVWLPDFFGAVRSTSAETAFISAPDSVQLAIVAVAAGIAFLVAAVAAAQAR